MPVITFKPSMASISVCSGTTILEASRFAGVLIEAPCNGAGHCGKCAVQIPTMHLEYLVLHEPAVAVDSTTSRVLACHAELLGDVTVAVSSHQETGLCVVDSGISRSIPLEPFITKIYITDRDETVVYGGKSVLGAERGDTSADLYGVVIDIGTTTLVAVLNDLGTGQEMASASALNPQSLHAQDVLSRIRFASSQEGLTQLQRELIEALNGLIHVVTTKSGTHAQHVYEAVLSGNTCMLHLAAGVDPAPLGKIPFTPTIVGGNHLSAMRLGLHIAPVGLVYLPPIISAYVGADISAGILAANLSMMRGVVLFIDIGTNGELALAVDGKITASATAAGPAFEGMNISCGMRAASGAIERVAYTPGQPLEIGVIGNGEPKGICGSGLMDLVSILLEQNIIGASGRFAQHFGSSEGLQRCLEGTGSNRQFRVSNLVALTQKDIRQVQLAKGAIRAGIEMLLSHSGLTPANLDRILIAGSFGYHLSEKSLVMLGLLPPETAGKINYLGNTSRSGGEMLLRNQHLRSKLVDMTAAIRTVDLAADPAFERTFVEAMRF